VSKKLTRATARSLWFEHGLPLLLFASLSVAFSWPTIRHFTTSITSAGTDARHLLWTFWHWKEALLGREPWYYTQLLFYPLGITLLTHATGPLQAVLATPFWLCGPEAAYNGALLTGLCLTGYFMYLLARSLGLSRGVALFAGVVLATAEIPLSAQWGHVSKTFLGLLPLALLTVLQAVNPRRSRWWAVATACVLLLALLHSGWQFVLASGGVGFFGLAGLLSVDRVQRPLVWRRLALLAVSSAVLVGPLLLAMRPFIPRAARRAAAVIAVSQATKADIVRILGVERAKVHVIHEAPAAHFRPLAAGTGLGEVRQRYGLPQRFLLSVGTIEPRKNLVRLLEALAQLRRSESLDHALILVGHRGWKYEGVFTAVERLALGDAVRFLGYVPVHDLVALYNLAQALVYPSLYEGFGLPVLEAMACGTPVVASSSSSLQEVAGNAAELVDPNQVQHIAAGLRRVLLDPHRRQELRALGLAQAARFSWDAASEQTRRIYDQAVTAG
jgi:glycosyltransferase involved in cell wall biosynthesis